MGRLIGLLAALVLLGAFLWSSGTGAGRVGAPLANWLGIRTVPVVPAIGARDDPRRAYAVRGHALLDALADLTRAMDQQIQATPVGSRARFQALDEKKTRQLQLVRQMHDLIAPPELATAQQTWLAMCSRYEQAYTLHQQFLRSLGRTPTPDARTVQHLKTRTRNRIRTLIAEGGQYERAWRQLVHPYTTEAHAEP